MIFYFLLFFYCHSLFSFFTIIFIFIFLLSFLDASLHLYKRVRLSICPLPFMENRRKAPKTALNHFSCIQNHYRCTCLPTLACSFSFHFLLCCYYHSVASILPLLFCQFLLLFCYFFVIFSNFLLFHHFFCLFYCCFFHCHFLISNVVLSLSFEDLVITTFSLLFCQFYCHYVIVMLCTSL